MDTREFRTKLGKALQREYTNKKFIVHADVKTLESEFGVTADSHILSDEAGLALFNTISEANEIPALRDPSGYMALDDNMSAFIHDTYEDRYTNMLYDVEDELVDGTGYGLRHVISSLNSTVRNDIKEYLPDDVNYGDLRFIKADAEKKQIVEKFVGLRLAKSLMYERKRDYEPATFERNKDQFIQAGTDLKNSLSGEKQESLEL